MQLSVILTVYNMERCLPEALGSIASQSFTDFEVLCINDGSTDGSLRILERAAAADPRFSVVTIPNGGPGNARNVGLGLAKGDYILMLDSDDLFEPTFFEMAINRALATTADVVIVRSDEFDDGSNEFRPSPGTANQEQIPDKLVFSSTEMDDYVFTAFIGWPWDKLYRRSFLEEHTLRFPNLPNSEDLCFVFMSIVFAERMSLVDSVLIHHRMNRSGSVSNSRLTHPEAFYEGICLLKHEVKTHTNRYTELSWGLLNWALHYTLWNIQTIDSPGLRECLLNKLLSGGYPELELDHHGRGYFTLYGDPAEVARSIQEDDQRQFAVIQSGQPIPATLAGRALKVAAKEGAHGVARRVANRILPPRTGMGLSHDRGAALHALPLPTADWTVSSPERATDEPGIAVSVVMPCYNALKYLDQAMQSVMGQTLQDIEIIAVNDGSTDETLVALERYAEQDPRIRIVTGENGGYGVAMNKGIDAARGKYVGILEPDDWIEPEMFRRLYAVAEAFDADAVKSDYFRFWTDDEGVEHASVVRTSQKDEWYNRLLNPTDDLGLFVMDMVNWTGIYRRSFLNEHQIRFHESPGASYQDNGFWFQVFAQAQQLIVVEEPFYHYRTDNSASSINQTNRLFTMFEEYAWIRQFLAEHPELEERLIAVYHYVKTFNLNFAFSILAPELRPPFAERYAREYTEALDKGELDRSLFWPDEWARVEAIMADPDGYCEEYNAAAEAAANAPEPTLQEKVARSLRADGLVSTAAKAARKLTNR